MARTPRAEFLVLDIETVPDVQRWARPAPPAADAPGAPARDVFPPAWAHRIVAVGYLWLDHRYRLRRFGVVEAAGAPADAAGAPAGVAEDERERALLGTLSAAIGAARPVIVSYNGRAFDLPVIALRSLCHAVPLPWYYRDKDVRYRYSEQGHLDLCDWLADHGAVRAGKLDQIARLVGLPGKSGVDGSQVEGLYQAGQLPAIERYCLADVAQTALLFLRFRLLQGQLAPDEARARTEELLAALAADGRVADVLEGLDRGQLLGGAAPSPR